MPKLNNDTYSGADFASGKVPGTKGPQQHGGIQGAEVVVREPSRIEQVEKGDFIRTRVYDGKTLIHEYSTHKDYAETT